MFHVCFWVDDNALLVYHWQLFPCLIFWPRPSCDWKGQIKKSSIITIVWSREYFKTTNMIDFYSPHTGKSFMHNLITFIDWRENLSTEVLTWIVSVKYLNSNQFILYFIYIHTLYTLHIHYIYMRTLKFKTDYKRIVSIIINRWVIVLYQQNFIMNSFCKWIIKTWIVYL